MDDDKIRDLFQGFQPRLSSDGCFMAELQRRMEAVEIVKQHNAGARRVNGIAVVVAALSGFVSGVLLTLLYPMISEWLSSILISLPRMGLPEISIDGPIASWLLIGGTCVAAAISSYDLTITRLSLNK